jgi:hypothetical protein
MALAHEPLHRTGRDPRSRPASGGHGGRDTLAEVIPIRPDVSHRTPGLIGSLITIALGFGPWRMQAAPVAHSPLPPSSPAPRLHFLPTGPPDDVA